MERSARATHIAIDNAIASIATPQWVIEHLNASIASDDRDRIQMYLDIAADRSIPLPDDVAIRARDAMETDLWDMATDCAPCSIDITQCPSLSFIGACFIPVQVSPAGDVIALGQEGWALVTGQEVDTLDLALAFAGVTATAVTIFTVGAALPAKVGITTLRVAKKADALSPAMTRTLRDAVRNGADTGRIMGMAGDATRIVGATSPAAALSIVRMSDSAADLKKLARFSEVAGPKTPRALAVLGKTRAIRIIHRISDAAIATFALVMAVIAQIGALIGAGIKLMLRHAAR